MANQVSFNINLRVNGKDVVKSVTMNVNELRQAVDATRTETERFTDSLVQINQRVETFRNMADGVAQLASTLNSLTEESRQYSAAMAAANTMAGKSGEDFANLKEQVSELSKTIPIARDQLANGLYQVISNGVPEDNWIEYLNQSAKASVGGIADLEEVVKVTSTVIKNYGLSWQDAGSIQDKIQLTAKNGVTSFEQMAQALPRVTANAATLGVTIDELMATFATLTGVSGNTAEVSTQLAAIFTALVKPSSEAAEMAKQMGIQFDAAAVKAAGGMQNFIQSLDQDVKSYAASSGMLEQEIYGKLFGSAESLRALIPLTGELADKFSQNVDEMQGSAGTIDDAFSIMGNTGAAQLQKLKNAFAGIGDALSGAVGWFQPVLNFGSQAGMTAVSVLALRNAFSGLNVTTKLASAATATFGPIVQVARAAMTGATVSAETLRLAIRGLMITTGVGIAVAALTEAVNYFSRSASSAKASVEGLTQSQMEAQQMQQQASQKLAEGRAELEANIQKLKTFKGSKEEEKAVIEQMNQTYGTTMGYYSSVSQWYQTLVANSKAYCAQLEIEAQIEARKNQIKKLAQKQYDLTHDEKGNKRTYSKTTYTGGIENYTDENGYKKTRVTKVQAHTTTWTGEQTKGWQDAEKGIKSLTAEVADLTKKSTAATNAMKGGKPTAPTATAPTSKVTPKVTPKTTTVTTAKDNPLKGSIDWYNEAIQSAQKAMNASNSTDAIKQKQAEISKLQHDLGELRIKLGIDTVPQIEVKKAGESILDKIDEMMKQNPIEVKVDGHSLDAIRNLSNVDLSSLDSVRNAIASIKDITNPTAKGMAAAGSACQALGNSMQQLGSDGAAAKAGMIMAALGQLALSFANAMNSASSNWITWLAFGVSGTAQLISMISMISGFATGGIVGGSSTSGDKLLVRVNSGEMILNAAQQARLFALANGAAYQESAQVQSDFARGGIQPLIEVDASKLQSIGSDMQESNHQSVSLRLKGRDLVGSLANETRGNRRRSNIKI